MSVTSSPAYKAAYDETMRIYREYDAGEITPAQAKEQYLAVAKLGMRDYSQRWQGHMKATEERVAKKDILGYNVGK